MLEVELAEVAGTEVAAAARAELARVSVELAGLAGAE